MKLSRPFCAFLDNILGEEQQVLTNGFVRVIDYMGDDLAIVQAARHSYGSGTKSISSDQQLLRTLMRCSHTSPFEMCELKLHLKMPIFIARQWMRHRTASLNEISGRYSILKNEFYLPEHICQQSKINKQGVGLEFDLRESEDILKRMEENMEEAFTLYDSLIKDDVAREQARMHLPLATYTEFYWKIDLHNLLHFLKLRLDSHAQVEIREYANVIANIVKEWCPVTFKAFEDYKINSYTLSAQQIQYLKVLLGNKSEQGFDIPTKELEELKTLLLGI